MIISSYILTFVLIILIIYESYKCKDDIKNYYPQYFDLYMKVQIIEMLAFAIILIVILTMKK